MQGAKNSRTLIGDLAAALAPYLVDPGSDGEFEHPDLASYEAGSYPGRDLKRDLVYTSGGFLRYSGER